MRNLTHTTRKQSIEMKEIIQSSRYLLILKVLSTSYDAAKMKFQTIAVNA